MLFKENGYLNNMGDKTEIYNRSTIEVDKYPIDEQTEQLKTFNEELDDTSLKLTDSSDQKDKLGGSDDSDSDSEIEYEDQNYKAFWRGIVQIFTCCFPEPCVPGRTKERRQAWREKVALNCLIYLFSLSFIFLLGVLPLLICPSGQIYTWQDIWAQRNADWIVVNGEILDVKGYISEHPGGSVVMTEYLGKDASLFFKRRPPKDLPSYCLNPDTYNDTLEFDCLSNNLLTDVDFRFKHCHSLDSLGEFPDLKTGELAYGSRDLSEQPGKWMIIFDRIYNTTEYIDKKYDYLVPELHSLVVNKEKEDATEIYQELYRFNETIPCLESQFFSGVLDTRYSLECRVINFFILISVAIVAAVMLIKFLVSIVSLGSKEYKEKNKYVLINIPCYTEDEKSLSKTIHSIVSSEYPDKHKMMIIVADGNIKGKGQKKTTPEIVLKILGRQMSDSNESFTYDSLGKGNKTKNIVKLYSGNFEYTNGEEKHVVPYLVVVKIGLVSEVYDKPGNRGKRDSQLILFRFLSKMFYNKELNELEKSMHTHIINATGVDPNKYEFMLTVDSDTTVHPDSMKHMVAHMNNNKIIAMCGETRVENKWDSWVSAIQVYEYYINHHLHKAFESLFGSVTCLPGCFSMYRLWFRSPHKRMPGLVHKEVLRDYSNNAVDTLHKRNLYELGEDRYLTSLLLKYFSHKKLVFITDAVCQTVVPNTWSVLKSQRRRWINSTIHNLFELVTLSQLRGVCCFSMKFIVFLDLISSFSLPVSIVYLGYLIYLFVTETAVISSLIIFVFIVIYVTQLLLFVFKREYSYVVWMLLYIFSIPLWYFILPIISWWRMDDFQWGQTRKVERVKLNKSSKYVDSLTARKNVVNG